MISVEGLVLPGLDEFMLRLGHLKVLCNVAAEVGGSWYRIERQTSEQMMSEIVVDDRMRPWAARYLDTKRLCRRLGGNSKKGSDSPADSFRYPNLVVEETPNGELVLRSDDPDSGKLSVWWQDYCLAAPEIRSRVGGVTSKAQSGSKTGLSHIADWAGLLDLATSTGELSAEGRLLAKLGAGTSGETWLLNPYVMGFERVIPAFQLLAADFDLFSRLIPRLIQTAPPIKKSTGAALFADALEEVATEAEASRQLSSRSQFRVFEQLRELEQAAKGKKPIGTTSTAWHRASSRLESYVDLGLLKKDQTDESEKYEYTYYPSAALMRAGTSLETAKSADEWLSDCLISVLFERSADQPPTTEDLTGYLPSIIAAVARPTAPIPITAVALGLVQLSLEQGRGFSLGAARRAIENLARERPELARLSRGGSGERAEFVSFDLRSVER